MSEGSESIRDKAYHYLQERIIRGILRPGSAVSELAVARELGSSRTPVREAMGQLVAEGFLEQIPNRGTVVVQLTRHDVIEFYELREALEVYAVGKAARQRIGSIELEKLEHLGDEPLALKAELEQTGEPRLNSAQMQRLMAADLAFHTMLLRQAGNARILRVVSDTQLLMRIFSIRKEGHEAAGLTQIHADHRGIVDAVREGDPERAMAAMSRHIGASRQERIEEFDRWVRESALERSTPSGFGLL